MKYELAERYMGVVQIIVEQNKYTYYIVFWILVLIRLSVSIYCVTDR